MGAVLTMECERARTWASLALDGELSQIEQALQRAHVGRCAACAEFVRDVGGLTQEIRAAPLERPPLAGLPGRRCTTGRRVLQLGSAAAAVALAAGLGSLAGSLTSGGGTQPPRVAAPAVVAAPPSQVPTARPAARLEQHVAL